MKPLKGEKLFDYLSKLESELKNRVSTSSGGSIESLMHSQMRKIINSESAFLKYLNSVGTEASLSISPNALPSVASLNPDLEVMCEISKEKKSFCEITKKFKKGMNGKNREEGNIYVLVSEDDWNEELKNRKKKVLSSDIGFSINETYDGKLELVLREDIYLQCLDKYSKEFPVLIREGKMRYHEAWGELIDEIEENFYVLNTSLVLKGKITKPSNKIFSNIKISYKFGRSDYKGVKKPWFLNRSRDSIDYSKFLAAGTDARVKTTENILEALKTALNRQVSIKGIRKNDLEQVLAFSMVPFKNAPRTIPKEEDFYEDTYEYNCFEKGEPKIPTGFDLIFASGGGEVGEIEYVLPHNGRVYRFDDSYRFIMGGISLKISGNAILNENQDDKLEEELKKVKKYELE